MVLFQPAHCTINSNANLPRGEQAPQYNRGRPKFVSPYRIAAVALAACFLQGCAEPPKNGALKDPNRRLPAPDFALKDADGKTVHLSDYKGKVVLLDFWATSCGPCRIEIPWFTEIQRAKKDQGFEVLGVSLDDGWDDVRPFVAEKKVNYRIVMGNDDTTHAYGGIAAIPTTLLIDKKGNIAAVHIGLASKSSFEAGIEALLLEKVGP
jgi:peroxiredoxin